MKKRVCTILTIVLVISSLLLGSTPILQTGCYSKNSLVVHSNGALYAWGKNNNGQLGDNSTTQRLSPVEVDMNGVLAGKTIKKITLGTNHAIALTSDDSLYAWGYNVAGQLGDNSSTTRLTSVPVDMSGVLADKTIIDIAAGSFHTLALASDGTLYSWGSNSQNGQLGDNSNKTQLVPVAVDMSGVLNGKTISKITAGNNHSLALASDGTLYAWGGNTVGQLGDGSTTNRSTPVAVDMSGVLKDKTISDVVTGAYFTLVLTSDGGLYSWGHNLFGTLGNNSTTNSIVPVAVDMSGVLAGKTISDISVGSYHSLVLTSDGSLYAWGNNFFGRLGDGTATHRHAPVAVDMSGVLAGKTMIDIATGDDYCMALASDYSIYTWGYNYNGQLGDNTTTNHYVPIHVTNADNSEFVLPIELSSFSVENINGMGRLTWICESETENLGFIIQRKSNNDESWQELASYLDQSNLEGHGSTTEKHNYHYTDLNTKPGMSYQYRIADVNYGGNVHWHKAIGIIISEENVEAPSTFGLQKAFPNPFNPSLTLQYALSEDSDMTLNIYDLSGHWVETLLNKFQHAGTYELNWHPQDLSSGVYIVRFQSNNTSDLLKLLLLK